MPMKEVSTTTGDTVSTTDGAVRLIDITTEGVVIYDMGTTEGHTSVLLTGYGKSDPPAY